MLNIKVGKLKKEVPDAFHGTDYDSAKRIEAEGKFMPSPGRDEYLGTGTYFFEGSKWHARDWAISKCQREKKSIYGIVKAKIDMGACLDLNNGDYKKLVMTVAFYLERQGIKALNDAAIINFISQQLPGGLDTVRATLIQPHKGMLHANSRFYYHGSLMICVRNQNKISDIELEGGYEVPAPKTSKTGNA